jgi:hypothetical protein
MEGAFLAKIMDFELVDNLDCGDYGNWQVVNWTENTYVIPVLVIICLQHKTLAKIKVGKNK